jgi:hypothetical protein
VNSPFGILDLAIACRQYISIDQACKLKKFLSQCRQNTTGFNEALTRHCLICNVTDRLLTQARAGIASIAQREVLNNLNEVNDTSDITDADEMYDVHMISTTPQEPRCLVAKTRIQSFTLLVFQTSHPKRDLVSSTYNIVINLSCQPRFSLLLLIQSAPHYEAMGPAQHLKFSRVYGVLNRSKVSFMF